ncbi:MAG: relaxase/mobilization nuclease domain-containing protein [Oscillospiraceae bacterium]|nr:relaxase/mobilization nuclease domain-containing protein [Oscillospiraceae bacterium]
MATTAILPIHAGGKGGRRPIAAALKTSVDYVKNPEKTDGGEWVTAFECDPLIADDEFLFSKRQYAAITGRNQGAHDVIAYHVRISFLPGETDAETANRIGYDLAMKLSHKNHAFICCTHTDKSHIHTHVIINSTSLDCTKKFRNFKGSAFAIRRIADHLCIENGLSIIEAPKPSRVHYGKWQDGSKPQSNRDKLKHIIDDAIEKAKDYNGFIAAMIAADCEVKRGKYLAFKIPGAGQFARCKSLGDDYTEEAIIERLIGLRKVIRRQSVEAHDEPPAPFVITAHTKFGLLIDIQQKIQEGKSTEAFEHWARIYNLKQAARTLIYLKEQGIDTYEELAKKSAASSSDFNIRHKRIKEIEARQKGISELQKQIGTYRKTRDIYAKYKASGWDRAVYDVHAADIILHRAAKKYFGGIGMKKLPSINALKQEWATLESERKTLYRGYKELRSENIELLKAKNNVERILRIDPDAQERTADRNKNRSKSYDR